jgi:hypothetical protein
VAIQGAHRKGAGFLFFATDGKNQGNLIQLGFTNFFIQTFGAVR